MVQAKAGVLAVLLLGVVAVANAVSISYTGATYEVFEAGNEAFCPSADYDFEYPDVTVTDSFNGDIDVCERVFKYEATDDDTGYSLTLCCTPSDRADMITGCEPFQSVYEEEGVYPEVCGDDDDDYTCNGIGTDDSYPVGTYLIEYTAMDASENQADPVDVTIVFEDTTAPTVEIAADDDEFVYTVEKCGDWSDLSVTSIDCVDGYASTMSTSITYSPLRDADVISGTNYYTESITTGVYCEGGTAVTEVDVDTAGVYCVEITAEDEDGNTATPETYVVYVKDTTAPEVYFTTSSDTYECADRTTLPDVGAYGLDTACGDSLTARNTWSHSQVLHALTNVGEYEIAFNSSDGRNWAVGYFDLTIEDTTAPTITCPNDVELEEYDTWTFVDATANDSCNGTVTIWNSGDDDVDTDTVGTYTITFYAEDESGNEASCTQEIMVEDTSAPVMTMAGTEYTDIEACGSAFADPGVTAVDDDGSSCTVTVSGDTVDVDVVGTYVIEYDSCDDYGNCADTLYRYVYVEDTTAPEIHTQGGELVMFEAGVYAKKAHATGTDTCAPYIFVPCVYCWSDYEGDDDCDDHCIDFTAEVVEYDAFTDGDIESEYWYSVFGDDADEYIYYCGNDYAYAEEIMEWAVENLNLTYFSQACAEYIVTYALEDANGNTATKSQNLWTVDTDAPDIDVTLYTAWMQTTPATKLVAGGVLTVSMALVVGLLVTKIMRRRQYAPIPV